jgi:hypothetical protein
MVRGSFRNKNKKFEKRVVGFDHDLKQRLEAGAFLE